MAFDWLNLGVSLFGGAGGALLLDVWWKPRRARHRTSVLLRAEIAVNRRAIEDAMPETGADVQIVENFSLPVVGWDAVAGEVGELPIALAQDVIALYHLYAKIRGAYASQAETVAEYRDATKDSHVRAALDNFGVVTQSLRVLMQRGLDASDAILARLDEEVERSILPGRRPRIAPGVGEDTRISPNP
jgi:hypothetical protein